MGFLGLVKSLDWEEESYSQYSDFVALPFFALFFPAVRFFLDRFVFEIVRSMYSLNSHVAESRQTTDIWKGMQVVENESQQHKNKVQKFKESAWKCIYYLSAENLALAVTHDEPWFKNTKYFWLGPGNQTWSDQRYKLKLKALYMFAGEFYPYSIFALIFWETRRSDFGVSMGHHVATCILIVFSYVSRFARVGSIVLAIHDASDVFLEVGKMSKYSGTEALDSVSFVLFVLSWILLHLIYYEVVQTLDKEKHKLAGPITTTFSIFFFYSFLLFSLLVLHIYWWILMFRMLVKQVQARGQMSEDVRSDSEDEDQHED